MEYGRIDTERSFQTMLMLYSKIYDDVLEFQRRQWHTTYLILGAMAGLMGLHVRWSQLNEDFLSAVMVALATVGAYAVLVLHDSAVRARKRQAALRKEFRTYFTKAMAVDRDHCSWWRHAEFTVGMAAVIVATSDICVFVLGMWEWCHTLLAILGVLSIFLVARFHPQYSNGEK